ncbi:MAG: AAA family ATPase, partial [Planctomycetes bacterium]|nr:AAA family ATPase [Planctomycetota bacterium]
MEKSNKRLASDKPLENPKYDKLGYANVSKKLAQQILNTSSKEGFVISVEGEWGSGKSTFIEFFVFYLKQFYGSGERPILVRFNPWIFSGHKDLIQQFFIQLNIELKKDSILSCLVRYVREYAALIEKLPFEPSLTRPIEFILWLLQQVVRLINLYNDDISKQKNLIIRELVKHDRRILIIIDDIDRLSDEEVKQIFKLIKAVANFHNIIYILAFDRHVIAKALSGVQIASGSDFIDKIVQLPIDLPKPQPLTLIQWFKEDLELRIAYFNKMPEHERNRWQSIISNFNNLFTSPRQVVRSLNAIYTTYQLIGDEVNIVDLISLEVIRTLYK